MAKLKARGRTELARLERTVELKEWFDYPEGIRTSRAEVRSYDVVLERHTYVLMSDTHILYKLDCTWHDGQKHTYNWTDKGKSSLTRDAFVDRLISKGYKEIK